MGNCEANYLIRCAGDGNYKGSSRDCEVCRAQSVQVHVLPIGSRVELNAQALEYNVNSGECPGVTKFADGNVETGIQWREYRILLPDGRLARISVKDRRGANGQMTRDNFGGSCDNSAITTIQKGEPVVVERILKCNLLGTAGETRGKFVHPISDNSLDLKVLLEGVMAKLTVPLSMLHLNCLIS